MLTCIMGLYAWLTCDIAGQVKVCKKLLALRRRLQQWWTTRPRWIPR